MALTHPLSNIREQLNKVFYDWTEDFGFPTTMRGEWPFRQKARTWFPSIELRDRDEELLLKAEIPGMKPEEVTVEVNENTVIISGETQEEKRKEKENLYHSEFQYGSFYRRIMLPTSVKSDSAKAEYKNGMLELHLPKQVAIQTKRIPVISNAK